ncbi:STM3941 family protein [Myroides fluvii]|uniref:STM3941 family protein n=1 Tax=Myroides fluvii TaxID=2572594 RepID=UPI00131E6EC0|nr:STM3941 family protein [Myroides fluvii]
MSKRVVFKLSKKDISCLILLLFVLITVGILFISYPSIFTSSVVRSELFIRIAGILISFFSIPLFIGYVLLLFEEDGLIVSNEGLINNTNLINIGQIAWKDITSIKTKKIKKHTLLLIFVKDESKYLKNKGLLKKINALGYKSSYGTSIVIETKHVLCTLEELKLTLRQHVSVE